MDVLEDERQRVLAPIPVACLPDGAGGGIGPERLVVGAAIVVAGQPESGRGPKYQKRRRERKPPRPPLRLWPEPGMRRVAEDLRRVEGREIRSPGVVGPLESRPGCVDDEAQQDDEGDDGRHPPGVAAGGLAEAARLGKRQGGFRHLGSHLVPDLPGATFGILLRHRTAAYDMTAARPALVDAAQPADGQGARGDRIKAEDGAGKENVPKAPAP